MKRWVLVIFYLNQTLEERCDRLQQRIGKLALNPLLPCGVLFERIKRLYDFKNGLVNLRVLYNAMAEELTSKERENLEKAALKNRGGYAGLDNESLRGLIRILKRCERVLAGYGFDEKRFESEYGYIAAGGRFRKKGFLNKI